MRNPGGNIRLVEALAKDIPIFYDHVVSGIDYCEGGVTLHTAQQSFTGALDPLAGNVSTMKGSLLAHCAAVLPPGAKLKNLFRTLYFTLSLARPCLWKHTAQQSVKGARLNRPHCPMLHISQQSLRVAKPSLPAPALSLQDLKSCTYCSRFPEVPQPHQSAGRSIEHGIYWTPLRSARRGM